MKNVTTYYSSRKNIFLWLSVLLSIVSAVTRIIVFGSDASEDFWMMVVHIILPLAANLCISVRLPWRCGEMFYVTVGPTILLAVYFFVRICELGLNSAMTISCLFLCTLQAVVFVRTFTGKMNSKLAVLGAYLLPVFFCMDSNFLQYLFLYLRVRSTLVVTDFATWGCLICIILCAKAMPEWKDGDPYRRKYGDRMDGRRVYTICPLSKLTAYFMPNRVGATNYITDSIEITNVERFIHEKRREGLKHFGIVHLFLAAYTRAVAEYPALNRFISGQKIYHRFDIVCSMVIKKEMSSDSPDTTIKVVLDPHDTVKEVYEKYDALVQNVKGTEDLNSKFDGLAAFLDKIPSLILSGVIGLFRLLDYFNLLPMEIYNLSPFHGSMFITSMGSLGIPPIFHHLYDFGNLSQFCAFGAKRTEKQINSEGAEVVKKYIDFVWATDERVCDGFYYATVLKKMKYYLMHPDILDNPPEQVLEDVD